MKIVISLMSVHGSALKSNSNEPKSALLQTTKSKEKMQTEQ